MNQPHTMNPANVIETRGLRLTFFDEIA